MTTIVLLPAPPSPATSGARGASAVPRGQGGTGTEFAATLDAALDSRRERTERAGATDERPTVRAGGESAGADSPPGDSASLDETSTTGASQPDVTGSAGQPGPGVRLLTVGQIVQAAAAMLAEQTTGPDGEALLGTGPDADAAGPLAEVIELAGRRAAAASRAAGTDVLETATGPSALGTETTGGLVPTQHGAPGVTGAAGASTTRSAGMTGTADLTAAASDGSAPAATPTGSPDAQVSASTVSDRVSTTTTSAATTPASATSATTVSSAAGTPAPAAGADTVAALGTTGVTAEAGAASPALSPASTSLAGVATLSGQATTGSPVAAEAPGAPAPPMAGPPLASQLGARLVGLRSAPAGEHVMVLRVDPESIGPVRVVAHIGPEGVRIELVGATAQARDALRTALPDLRRDLVAAGLPADLGLGSGDGSSSRGHAGQNGQAQGAGDGSGSRAGQDARDGRGTPASRSAPGHPTPTDSLRSERPGLDLIV